MDDRRFIKLILLNHVTSAHCFITQMSLSMALSYMFSNSIAVFSLFAGLYLMSMGIGVFVVERFRPDPKRLVGLILLNSALGVVLANPGITGLLLFNEYAYYALRTQGWDMLWLMFPLGIVFTVLIGMVSGAELPIFSKLIEAEGGDTSKPIIGVLMSDYFGASAGVALFAFVLYPFFGLIQAIIISQAVALACINGVYFSMDEFPKRGRPAAALGLLTGFIIVMMVYKDRFVCFIDALSGW